MWSCGRSWRSRRGGAAVAAARRIDVHAEGGADAGVRRFVGGPLEVGGVLNGLQVVVERVGVVVADGGGVEAAADAAFLYGVGSGHRGDGGGKGGGIGINPALGLEGGEVGGVFDAGENDVGAADDVGEVEVVGDADLELFAQFHALAFEGEGGGLFGAAGPFVQDGEGGVLLGGEIAEAAFFIFHVVDVGGDGADEGAGGGGEAGGQAGVDAGVVLGGGGDEVAFAQEGGDGEVEFQWFAHGSFIS